MSKSELFPAARVKNYRKIGALIRMGADPNSQDDNGQTILHIAAENGDIHLMHYFLYYVKASVKIFDKNGRNFKI